MASINVLGFDVANLIAAGEVVDRPASAVKELIENSIDAGASSVTVEIRSGGTRSIRVSDNGCGIGGDDLPLAVLRHATSKISTASDLAAIGTLGFRGEALAAISAVTRLRIISKIPGDTMGHMLQCDGGEIVSFMETGCSAGTTVVAEELFYNVPARRKFLKKDASETAAVTAVVEKIAISAPHISIKYIADGDVRFMTSGDGDLYNTIYAVLGKEIASRTLRVNRADEAIRVSGFISEPDFVRSKRTLELFFINGRYVLSRTASAAIEQAYSARIPNEKFPFCALNIELNPEAVDVNVHPSKLEVKFSNERMIFEAVYYAVLTALESSGTRPELVIGYSAYKYQKNSNTKQISSIEHTAHERKSAASAATQNITAAEPWNSTPVTAHEVDSILPSVPDTATENDNASPENKSVFSDIMAGYSLPSLKSEAGKSVDFVDPREADGLRALSSPSEQPSIAGKSDQIRISAVETQPVLAVEKESETAANAIEDRQTCAGKVSTVEIVPDYTILGEAYNCYIIVQMDDRLVLIDKHAAHERIIFDSLRAGLKNRRGGSQSLMFPLKLTLTEPEIAALDEFDEKIRDSGFEFYVQGHTVSLSGVPNIIDAGSATDMFLAMVSALAENTGTVESIGAEYFERALYRASCKAAIKGGKIYGSAHLKWICDRILQRPGENGQVIKTCPHGRPVAFEIKKSSIERQFSRIV